MAALDVLVDERLADRAMVLGEKFRSGVEALKSPLVATVRGRGLLNAIVIDEAKSLKGRTAWQLCLLLKSRGVLAKPTHVNMYAGISPFLALVILTELFQHPLCSSTGYRGGRFVESRQDYRRVSHGSRYSV